MSKGGGIDKMREVIPSRTQIVGLAGTNNDRVRSANSRF
jgi:hypothetical protein